MGGRGRQISEFEASLVYRVISRTARAIQRNPVSKKPNPKKNNKKKISARQFVSETSMGNSKRRESLSSSSHKGKLTCTQHSGRQRQTDFWVQGQPGLQSEFQDSQGYTEKPCLAKTKSKNKQTKKQTTTTKK